MAFECDECNASYSVRKSLLNHKRLKHGNPQEFACQHCVYKTTKKENLEHHVRSRHEKIKEICQTCGKSFSDKSNLNRHSKMFHGEAVQGTKRKATEPLVQQSNKHGCNKLGQNHANFVLYVVFAISMSSLII